MPTRVLREGILDSKAVNSISEEAELLYRRLYSIVDDFGRFEFDSDLIRARAFPRQMDRWDTERIHRVMRELSVDHGYSPLITVYHCDGKNIFQINKFGQRCQSKEKYPPPDSPRSTVIHGDPPHRRDETETRRRRVDAKSDISTSGKREVLVRKEVLETDGRNEKTRPLESREEIMRAALEGYMQMAGTQNQRDFSPPDEKIIRECLEVVNGTDLRVVTDFLKDRFFDEQSPIHPTGPKKYAWFVTVLRQKFGTHR